MQLRSPRAAAASRAIATTAGISESAREGPAAGPLSLLSTEFVYRKTVWVQYLLASPGLYAYFVCSGLMSRSLIMPTTGILDKKE